MEREREFKVQPRCLEVRKRRMQQTIRLRKAKTEKIVKRHRDNLSCLADDCADVNIVDVVVDDYGDIGKGDKDDDDDDREDHEWIMEKFRECVVGITQDGFVGPKAKVFVESARLMLSSAENPPVHEAITSGIVYTFIQLMSPFVPLDLQLEATWAITNIVSTVESYPTKFVVDHGIVPLLLQQLDINDDDNDNCLKLKEQALWALGNIAAESLEIRDYILSLNAIPKILPFLHPQSGASDSMIAQAIFVASNLCMREPKPDLRLVGPLLTVIPALLYRSDTPQILLDTLWCISHLSEGSNPQFIAAILSSGIAPKVVNIAAISVSQQQQQQQQRIALKTIGNIIASDDDEATNILLSVGVLHTLFPYMSDDDNKHAADMTTRKEVCWILSNIAGGSCEQIKHIVEYPRLLESIFSNLQHGSFEIRRECVWIVANICNVPQHIETCITTHHCIELFVNFLNHVSTLQTESRSIVVILETIVNIFNSNIEHCAKFECAGGLAILEALETNHDDEMITEMVSKIVDDFFSDSFE